MKKLNCWEITHCGREPGGNRTDDRSVCPAAVDVSSNGINGGENGGRICWVVAGTFCRGKIQGEFALETVSCMTCDVFKQISAEENVETFILLHSGESYSTILR